MKNPQPQGPITEVLEKARVLYLDDDTANLETFLANFRNDYQVSIAESPIQAYNMIQDLGIQIVITDHQMPSMSGVEFLETLVKDYPRVQRILLTGFSDAIPLVEAVNRGKVFGVLHKPFELERIRLMIDQAASIYQDEQERDQLIHQLRRQNQQFEFILRQRLLS
ncbi:MAG: response regulator [Flavobacteriales bacterium]